MGIDVGIPYSIEGAAILDISRNMRRTGDRSWHVSHGYRNQGQTHHSSQQLRPSDAFTRRLRRSTWAIHFVFIKQNVTNMAQHLLYLYHPGQLRDSIERLQMLSK
jgi:hypothetical protein